MSTEQPLFAIENRLVIPGLDKNTAKLECHDFGRKKASKNSIVAPTLKNPFLIQLLRAN